MIPAYITMALLMGLAGGLHCAGMCGPIMLFMPFHHFAGWRKPIAIGLYHFCRISVYTAMAFVVYSFRNVFDPRLQQYVSTILGCALLLAGLVSFLPVNKKYQLKLPWAAWVTQRLGSFMGRPGLLSIVVSGLLNGLLPCGLVYMALSAALTLQSTVQAVVFVYVFGLGTLPVLVAITLFRSRIILRKGQMIRKFTPVIVFSFGCIFLLRGLNLGIPYLSPKVQISNGQIHSCCHKK
jgi:sulfite exporter TauE/SafE